MAHYDSKELQGLREVAAAAAYAGGRQALQYFRSQGLAVEWKEDESPVTQADKETEALIRETIYHEFPDDGWIGEETPDVQGFSGRRWIVDPIDGTRNFIRGVPLWATLVACEADTPEGPQIIASAVYLPGLDEQYEASLGGGATCNGESIAVSKVDSLDQALWCFETPGWYKKNGLGSLFEELSRSTHLQRGLCDAYGHMLVATGRAEAIVEPELSIWDIAATSLIVCEAGGSFTDLQGEKTIRHNQALVTNGMLHQTMLDLIAQHQ